jgi:Lipocalin-like domain
MTAKRALVIGTMLVSLAGLGLARAQRPATSAPSVKEQVIGTWRLVARDVVHPDGSSTLDPAYGPKYPIGYIMYDNTGHMAVQFMGLDRPNDGSARAYDAYFGTYTIDETSNPPKVTHHREGSLNPRAVGGDVVRDLLLDGDELKLVVHNNNNANVNVNTFHRVK